MRARARERRHPPQQRTAEDGAAVQLRPQLGQRPHAAGGRIGAHRRAVDRPHRRPEHEVRDDPALEQRGEHADLVRAERATPSAEHEHDTPGAGHQLSSVARGRDDVAVAAAANGGHELRRGVGGLDDVRLGVRAGDDRDRHADPAQLAPRRRPARLAGVVGEEAQPRRAGALDAIGVDAVAVAQPGRDRVPGPALAQRLLEQRALGRERLRRAGNEREQRRVGDHRGARELGAAHEQLEHDERAESVADEQGGRGVERRRAARRRPRTAPGSSSRRTARARRSSRIRGGRRRSRACPRRRARRAPAPSRRRRTPCRARSAAPVPSRARRSAARHPRPRSPALQRGYGTPPPRQRHALRKSQADAAQRRVRLADLRRDRDPQRDREPPAAAQRAPPTAPRGRVNVTRP